MPLCQSLSPVALVCEDKASHERHFKALKKEYTSLHPNKQVYSVTIFFIVATTCISAHQYSVYTAYKYAYSQSIPGTHVYHALLYV